MKHPAGGTRINVEEVAAITGHQLNDLVNVIGSLAATRQGSDDEEWKKGSGPEMDGGCVTAIDTAIIAAADRITAIVGDSRRWAAQHDKVRRKVVELLDAQIDTQNEAATNEALKRRPTQVFKPHFLRIQDGRWTAYLTDDRGTPSVMGVGTTPNEAAMDFDRAFLGGGTAELRTYDKTTDTPSPADRESAPSTEAAPGDPDE